MTQASWPPQRPQGPYAVWGWFTPDNHAFLEPPAKKARTILEIGSWMGRSTRFLAEMAPEADIHCVDTWEGGQEHQGLDVLKHIHRAFIWNLWDHRHRVFMHQGTSRQILPRLEIRPDLIYIDGSHAYEDVFFDILHCVKTWPEAAIVGDDWQIQDVRRAVKTVVSNHPSWRVVHQGNAWRLVRVEDMRLGAGIYWKIRAWIRRILAVPYRFYEGVSL